MTRHFLSILDLDREAAHHLVDRAVVMKEQDYRGAFLHGRTVVLIFEKASTRTRLSFEVACNHLGAARVFMTPMESQLGRSEPLKDTARVVSRYADAMIVRTYAQDKLVELADFSTVPVVNALSDDYHPCQVMSDVLTMSEALGGVERLQGTKVAWIGDGNNMAHSFMNAAVHFGFDLHLACPPGYDPDRGIMERCVSMGASITLGRDPRQAAQGARFLNTDVWASMGEEAEQAERAAAFKGFSIGRELLALASPDARVMHCLPAHRGEEIAADVLEGPASIVWDQAENRLHMQKSILEWLFLDRESQVVRDG